MIAKTLIRAAFLAVLAATPVAAQGLQAPFSTRSPDPRASQRPCPVLMPPVAGFDLPSKYGRPVVGDARDRTDEEAEAAFERAMAPIKAFAQTVVKAANDYHRTGRASAADCALAHLAHWARGEALERPQSHTAWYKLATTTAGLSAALLQIAPAVEASADHALARRWLAARAQALRAYFDRLDTPRSSKNNHRAWAGLAAASAGVAAGDRGLVDWGMASYRLVICQTTPEGALPLELERGAKAREYHLYALAALAPLAEIGERNGVAAYDICGGAIRRVAAYTLAALADPSDIERLSGRRQAARDKPPTGSKLTFLEPYLKRFPETAEAAAPWLKQRPLALTDLGGDQTLLYRR